MGQISKNRAIIHIMYYDGDMSITTLYEQGANKERIGLYINGGMLGA